MKTQQTQEESGCPDYFNRNKADDAFRKREGLKPKCDTATPAQAPRKWPRKPQTTEERERDKKAIEQLLGTPEVGHENLPSRKPDPASYSPLPWRWWTEKSGRPKNYDLAKLLSGETDQSGELILTVYGGEGINALGTSKRAKANAAFIVRACNEYESLVKDVAYWQKHHDALQRALNQKDKKLAHAQRLADALKSLVPALEGRGFSPTENEIAAVIEALAQWTKYNE